MAENPSPLDAVREVLREPRPHTLEDVARAAEVDPGDLARLFAAGERDDEDGYGDTDVEYARHLAVLLRYAPIDVVERETRMRVRVVGQVAVNDLASVRLSHQIDEALQSGVTPDQLGEALAHIARTVLPAVGRLLELDHRRVLEQLINTEVVEAASRDWGRDTIDMSVGFVDLVGFTRLSAATDPDGLGTVLTAFEKLATEAAKDVGDVLLAKTIGDAVMLVSGHPDRLATVLTRIVLEEPEGLQDVGRRAGMAAGEVVVREGDYVGTTVNTAARLTDLARPASVVVSADTADRLDPERWQTSRLPPVRLKGLGHARPIRIRPADGG